MKRSTIAQSFTAAAVTVLALGLLPTANAQNKGCSNASLQGTYAYTSTGTITSPAALAGPVAEVGMQTFDGQGNTTATALISQNGNITPLTITGTYTMNQNCTGTLTLQVVPFGITVVVYIVLDNNWTEFQAIENGPGLVITRVGRVLYPGRAI
jgi:hypothetical protein